ncbi:hypothetical protein ETAA8_63960 [Anatilimnocola aggregata]|uniref:Uncharacterized protein n=1 Tax=Anatilimnocola aggregata TaxID=2528021 RepID=A0A517YM01_9BACT|nr:hypothetical protein [Anatilimnocola aggregata]QDU31243.1 hypothetical protein ETAA8_63960 [Anatilimnocola aggregata]
MGTKAHSTVVNRIIDIYQGELQTAADSVIDVIAGDKLIAVESSANLEEAVKQLMAMTGLRYIATTNHDSLVYAQRLCAGTPIGLINSQGDIVKEAAEN